MNKGTAPQRKLRTVQLAAVIFLTISGGPYGLEALLKHVGANGAIALLLLTPLLWDIPTILTVLELNSMMPVNGGYYQWVKRAMGLRFAWYEGLWTWFYTFVDLAIYPVLFVEYLSFLWPEVKAFKVPICLLIIWSSALLNIRGVVPVGRMSEILGIVVLTPFFVMLGYFIFNHQGAISFPAPSVSGLNVTALGLGFYTVMWNFLGWDNVTTYAEEVTKPIRSYLVSVGTAFVLIFVVYMMTIFIASQSGIDYGVLKEDLFPALGKLIGGEWLGNLIALGGIASGLGLYSGVLMSVSRVPKVMSDDELLPAALHHLHPKYQTPWVSIITCSVVVSAMILLKFQELLIMDVIVYGAALFLEFFSLIILRKRFPDEHRPFKIPLKLWGIVIMVCLPIIVYCIALTGALFDPEQTDSTWIPVALALGALLLGEVIWRIIVWRKPHLRQGVGQFPS